MYSSEIVGQEPLKLQLKKMVSEAQMPHCQLFIDSKGFGGLPLALYSALGLLLSLWIHTRLDSSIGSGK